MPQATHKFDSIKMRKLLEQETEYISNLFAIFDVPDSVEGNFHINKVKGKLKQIVTYISLMDRPQYRRAVLT